MSLSALCVELAFGIEIGPDRDELPAKVWVIYALTFETLVEEIKQKRVANLSSGHT